MKHADRSDMFSRRSAVFLKLADLLDVAAKRERDYRNMVNFGSYVAALVAVVALWRNFDVRHLVGVLIGFVALRIVGNGVVGVWCNAELRRIEDANPMPEEPAEAQGRTEKR